MRYNYLGLWETAIIACNHIVLSHLGVLQIFPDNSKKIYGKKKNKPKTPLSFLIRSMFIKVSMTEVKPNPIY